jgi:NAD(P)-dependent dehydrogenase (short-subunit alcohol dehydrogenase family)
MCVSYSIRSKGRANRINLTEAFRVTQRATPLLRQSSAALVVVMSFLVGLLGYPNRGAYSATKWGAVGFTQAVSLEHVPLGITARIHPRITSMVRIQAVLEGRAKASGRTVEEGMDLAMEKQSVRKFVHPDIAALALFLAGPHARTISGQRFPIDGDLKAAT